MADQNSSGRPQKRLKTDHQAYDPHPLGSAAVDDMDSANRVSGTSGSSGDTEPLSPRRFAEYQGQDKLPVGASGASGSRHVSSRGPGLFGPTSPTFPPPADRGIPRFLSSLDTSQQHRVQNVEDPFISPQGSEGPGSPIRESIEKENTNQRRVMWAEQSSQSQREGQLLTAPAPPFGPLERRDYERRQNSLPLAQVTQGRPYSMEPPSVPILPQPSPLKRAFVRGGSVPQEIPNVPDAGVGYDHSGFTNRSPGTQPNRSTYAGIQTESFERRRMLESINVARNALSNLAASMTGKTGEEARSPDDSDSEVRLLPKEARRRRPSLGFNFDPESERQRELEERTEAEGPGPMAVIGECKYLWFGVIFIFVGMFLCLFLYSFGVIK